MNTDNDVNVSRLVTKLGLNRRQFLAATTGMAAAAAVTAPSALAGPVGNANGILIPAPRRGIILYTVRDAISRNPLTSDLASGFKEVLAELSTIGYRQIEFAGFTQNANSEGGANLNTVEGATLLRSWLDANGLEAEGNHGSIPSTVTDATIAPVRHRLRDRQHPGHGPHRHGQRPDRQRLRRRLGGRRRALELLRRAGLEPRAEALHAQPRHRLQLPARQRPAGRARPPDPQQRHPSARVLPGQHRPEARLPRDGHLLGARRAVQAPHVHRARRLDGASRSSTRPAWSPRRPSGSRCSTPRTARRTPTQANGYVMAPFGQGDIDYSTFLRRVGAKGSHNPMWEQDTAPGGTAAPGPVPGVREDQLRHMAALRG